MVGERGIIHVPIPGTRHLAPDTWYQILSTRHLVPKLSTRYLVLDTWYEIIDTLAPLLESTCVVVEAEWNCVIFFVIKKQGQKKQRQHLVLDETISKFYDKKYHNVLK